MLGFDILNKGGNPKYMNKNFIYLILKGKNPSSPRTSDISIYAMSS